MDEGCLFFLLEAFGNFLVELLGHLCVAGWKAGGRLTAWLYREGPTAVRIGARLGLLAGALWGLGLGLRFCPAWVHPPALSAGVAALIVGPVLGMVGGLTGWAVEAGKALGVRR